MNSTKKTARVAGLLWLLTAVTGGFGLFYIRTNILVPGDAAATAGNILASEFIYRTAIVSILVAQVFMFFFGLTLVRSIGADQVIDYTQEDFTKGAQRYDLIFDCISNHSLSACRRVLNPNGKFVIVGASKVRTSLSHALKGLVLSRFVSQNFVIFIARLRKDDLTILGELMRAGKVTPVIDRTYPLSEVPDAFRYLEAGHARGKIVITWEANQGTATRGKSEHEHTR